MLKGHDRPRLQGVLGGIYSDPNDLAFAIVLSLPLCLALCLNSRGALRKAIWGVLILIMGAALMLTASRAGFIDLVISMTVCLWHFGIRGRRLSLVVGTVVIGAALLLGAGGRLKDRFLAMTGTGIGTKLEISASGSFEERRFLMIRSLVGIMHYPILGVGVRNFAEYSGIWKVVHASYLQIGVEGGIPVMVLYLMFFWRGFANLRMTKRIGIPDREISLFYGALHSSLVGFVVGACFAPEAYQFFPYFTVAYTSVFFLIIKERQDSSAAPVKAARRFRHFTEVDATDEPPAVLPSLRS
ncbi:MAG: hypothetical protein DMG97_37540 [Acidobacteria bacterium]|nr:MAG: hypothetical protein DMG97_37540 [Acidobacteriota bacterium]